MKNWFAFVCTFIAGVFLAILAITPPSPVGSDYDKVDFSSARAMEDVRVIAAEPHVTGTPENAKVRAYIKSRLEGLGLSVEEHASEMTGDPLARLNRWTDEEKASQIIYNITGILKGADSSKPALLLMAHHDTVWDSPGASDDTIGIAVILEILRAIKADKARERDVIVLITDAEELGLVGAVNFFKDNPLRNRVGAIINFEARGAGGTANLFQLNHGNSEAARLFGKSVREPSASSLAAYIYSILPNDTDLTPALSGDYIAYNIAILGKAGMYHSPLITPDELEESSVQHMGIQGLDLTRALISADALPEKSGDAVFFDVFGLFVLAYAPLWGWVFLLAGIGLYLLSVRGKFDRSEIANGVVRMMLFVMVGAVVLYGLNWLSGYGKTYEGIYKQAGYYDRLAAIPRLEIIALLTCLAAVVFFFGKGEGNENRYFGLALPLIGLGIAGQILAPTATYFISLPIFLAGLSVFALSRWPGKAGVVIAVLGAIPVFGYMLGLEHLVLLGVGPDLLYVAILPAALSVIILYPLFPGLSQRWVRLWPIALLVLAVVIALWVRLDPVALSAPTYRVW